MHVSFNCWHRCASVYDAWQEWSKFVSGRCCGIEEQFELLQGGLQEFLQASLQASLQVSLLNRVGLSLLLYHSSFC
jgi:hypothetical protein